MAKAAFFDDEPIERFKMIIASQVSAAFYSNNFEKPLNPILGETYQAYGQDGAIIFGEQISHHPPTSSFLIEHKNYTAT